MLALRAGPPGHWSEVPVAAGTNLWVNAARFNVNGMCHVLGCS